MLYRQWLNLNVHLLWCHNQPVAKGWEFTAPTRRFTQYTNSGAWLVREGWARVEHDGQIHTAEPGQWLIVKPGNRIQTFTSDTRMLSVSFEARWPDYVEALTLEDSVEIAIQVLGKLRGTVSARRGAATDEIREAALADERIAKHVAGQEILKVIHVPDRLMNFVVARGKK